MSGKKVVINKPKTSQQSLNSDQISEENHIRNQKKDIQVRRKGKGRKSVYLTEYMKTILKPKGKSYFCDLCPDKAALDKKNITRHFLDCITHSNSIISETDQKGHEELLPLLRKAKENNKQRRFKNREVDENDNKEYLKFIAFCQSQNFSFKQISALGIYLQDLVTSKKFAFLLKNTFKREEISLIARSFGSCLVEELKEDLISGPFSFTIDNSTIARKNITALKVRYLKETKNEKGLNIMELQSKVIGLKYLEESSNAKKLLDITKTKLLDDNIKPNVVGFVHDHASVLSGVNKGLGTLLQKECGKFMMDLKDICHGLNLALTQSFENLPEGLMKFITDIHNHFTSPQRVSFLNKTQKEKNLPVLCPKHYVKTRWLSLGQSIERLINIWESLIEYMKKEPSFAGVKKSKYKKLLLQLEDKQFKLQIILFAGIVKQINETNIEFQNQHMEIGNLKTELFKCLKGLLGLYVSNDCVPKELGQFAEPIWQDINNYKEKFLPPKKFIETLALDLDMRLKGLETLSEKEQIDITNTYQDYLSKFIKTPIGYLPINNDLINCLDFVNLNMGEYDFKSKVITFNKFFKVMPEEKLNELSKEISLLFTSMNNDILMLKRESKNSSLILWSLIKETLGKDQNGYNIFPHLSKILNIAHVLPTTSAGVEQTFSLLKLIRSSLRTNLREETVQSLALIHQRFQDIRKFSVSDEMLKTFDQAKMKIIERKKEEETYYSCHYS